MYGTRKALPPGSLLSLNGSLDLAPHENFNKLKKIIPIVQREHIFCFLFQFRLINSKFITMSEKITTR